MKTIYDEVKQLLENEPRARERRHKDRAIRYLLIEKYPVLKDIPKETLVKAFKEYSSYDRAWRKTTEENPNLRGADYYQKFQLEQKKQAELGYNLTYN